MNYTVKFELEIGFDVSDPLSAVNEDELDRLEAIIEEVLHDYAADVGLCPEEWEGVTKEVHANAISVHEVKLMPIQQGLLSS